MTITKVFEYKDLSDILKEIKNASRYCLPIFRIEFSFDGAVAKNGMIIERSKFNCFIKQALAKLINEYVSDKIDNPTSENIIGWIARQIHENELDERIKLKRIVLWSDEFLSFQQDY